MKPERPGLPMVLYIGESSKVCNGCRCARWVEFDNSGVSIAGYICMVNHRRSKIDVCGKKLLHPQPTKECVVHQFPNREVANES